ncbi:CG31157 [Drosophila busckii]|uniref:CG31157 n=1 Tax=Drosophila busckii TaxID=30019 RepID=A0A0M4EK67_DROBS|nr:CG31157 [Drosophila busckii]
MVAPSKIFKYPLNRIHCSKILHSLPHQSCTEAFIWNLYRNHVSSAKYYLPILLFPLVFNWRKRSKSRLWCTVKNYVQVCSLGAHINALTFYLMCIFRHLNGRFVKCYTPFISCFLGSQIIWLAPGKVQLFYVTGITHAAIEGAMRQLNLRLVHSGAAQTLVFMICSLLVLQQQQSLGYTGFWFIRPRPLTSDYHKMQNKARLKQALMELFSYLQIGLAMDALHAILTRSQMLRKLQLKTTGFMLSYMGIYKRIPCSQLLVPFNLAYLVHILLFQHHVLNGLANGFINGTCDKNAQRVYEFILQPVETILSTASKIPDTPFLF